MPLCLSEVLLMLLLSLFSFPPSKQCPRLSINPHHFNSIPFTSMNAVGTNYSETSVNNRNIKPLTHYVRKVTYCQKYDTFQIGRQPSRTLQPLTCSGSCLNLESASQLACTWFWYITSQTLKKRLKIWEGVCTPQSNNYFTKLLSRENWLF